MPVGLQTEEQTRRCECAQLLVHSWRQIMARGVECPLIERQFRCACGAGGEGVFRAFCTFLCALALSQRRGLAVNPPGWEALSGDEVRMLRMISAAQRRGSAAPQMAASTQADRPASMTLEASVRELATMLARSGQRLRNLS